MTGFDVHGPMHGPGGFPPLMSFDIIVLAWIEWDDGDPAPGGVDINGLTVLSAIDLLAEVTR